MTEEQQFIFDLKENSRPNPDITHGSRNRHILRIADLPRAG